VYYFTATPSTYVTGDTSISADTSQAFTYDQKQRLLVIDNQTGDTIFVELGASSTSNQAAAAFFVPDGTVKVFDTFEFSSFSLYPLAATTLSGAGKNCTVNSYNQWSDHRRS
jgi:hypothetical protein